MNTFKYKNGDWVVNETLSGDEELIQTLTHLIYTRVSEWFLNKNHGFRRHVLETKQPNEREITQAFYDCLYQEPRIREVITIDYEFDRIKRKLKINFKARDIHLSEVGGEINVDLTRV